MNIIMAVIGLVGLKRAPECIKMHHFEGENAKIFLGRGWGTAPSQTLPPLGRGIPPPQTQPPSTPSAPPSPQTTFLDTGLSSGFCTVRVLTHTRTYTADNAALPGLRWHELGSYNNHNKPNTFDKTVMLSSTSSTMHQSKQRLWCDKTTQPGNLQ